MLNQHNLINLLNIIHLKVIPLYEPIVIMTQNKVIFEKNQSLLFSLLLILM